MNSQAAARAFLEGVPEPSLTLPIPDVPGLSLIRQDVLVELADEIQEFIAIVIADLIGAGSERDAVMEDEELNKQIFEQLKGWSDHPDNAPQED